MNKLFLYGMAAVFSMSCATPTRLTCRHKCALQDLACAEAIITGPHADTVRTWNKQETLLSQDQAVYRCGPAAKDQMAEISTLREEAMTYMRPKKR
jgi:hypothetical protein